MADLFTVNNILTILGLLGILFGVYHYFKNPQIDGDKRDALMEQRTKMEKAESDRRFSDMTKRLDDAFALAQNHIHTVDTKVDNVAAHVTKLSNEITRLSTIIEERIPRK